jgi:hydroxyacylglutathione hydrolase
MKLFFHYSLHGFSNVYLVGPDEPGDAILVDPSCIDTTLLSFIEKNGYNIRAALITHNHPNHVNGIATLRKIWDIQVYSASAEIMDIPCEIVNDKQQLSLCGFDVEVLSLPGHSPDSVVYRFDKVVFTGDSISAGLIGNTNSNYGARQLLLNLWQKVLSLPDDTMLMPGHGPPTTVHAERLYNIGLTEQLNRASSRFRDIDFFMDG